MQKIKRIFICGSAAVFFLFLVQFTYAEQVKAQDGAGEVMKSQGAPAQGQVKEAGPQVTPLKPLEVITPTQEDHQEMEGHEHHHDMTGVGHWMAPEEEAKKTNPVQVTEASAAHAKELFKQKCVLCHGEGGKGDGPLADTLDPRPSDLAGEMIALHPDGDLFYKISKGRGAMPAWESVFSEEDRWDLVNFIRSLKQHEQGDEPDKK
ncbi:MAG: cytochrome c [bacterium]